MSKRSGFPQYGDRKKAKLDISRSEHHFPASQNISSSNKENNCDDWGDEVDEAMLLQASQACEEEQINDTSLLPDYNLWKQPGSTSTQYMHSPSTSKASFEFKKPSSNLPSSISTQLKNKCNTISSPLPGISTLTRDRHSDLTNDLIGDKIVQGQDSDIRRKLLQLEEKCSNISDKLVTKEGESSILRSQIRNLQSVNDNLRMEKIRAQEQIQMEHNERLNAITKEMQSLKTELEFKDLEILAVKDKLKKIEANKLRLTQISEVSRNNNTLTAPYDGMITPKKAKTTSNSAQTEDKAPFLKLNKSCGKGLSKAGHSIITPGPAFVGTSCLLLNRIESQDNEQLQLLTRVHQEHLKLEAEVESLTSFTSYQEDERAKLDKVMLTVSFRQLFENRPLFNGERGVEARVATVALANALQSSSAAQRLLSVEPRAREHGPALLDTAIRICSLIEKTQCSYLYSGFLMSLISTFNSLYCAKILKPKIFSMTKAILLSKPLPFVTLELLAFVRKTSSLNNSLAFLCPSTSDVGMDVEMENVNSELCYLVLLLKQTEDCLACIKARSCGHSALIALRNLVGLFEFVNDKYRGDSNSRCECLQLAARAAVRALRGAVALVARARAQLRTAPWYKPLLAACRSAVQQVHKCVATDAEWITRLHRHEGLLSDAVYRMHKLEPGLAELTELKNSFLAAPEDAPPSYLQLTFMADFETFSMTD